MSEGLSDDGTLTGRGGALARGLITGLATFLGGAAHTLPFLIGDVDQALKVAYAVVGCELLAIAWLRRRYLRVSLAGSLIQVTLAGGLVAAVGVAVGHADRERALAGALGAASWWRRKPSLCPDAAQVCVALAEISDVGGASNWSTVAR